ncbi:hypothetical protein [Flavobacterium sp. NRK1]|uniref:hypothetical protein n=1 Tax=Flavobacterium sp. NRK1 TaxID=2954929 RepID=UPI002092F990|nr:hypothetical protein [Flavobacterium sp. NRK1]MCO6149307.1 hypothetical protein [Flavobacterium sp. NRK1]
MNVESFEIEGWEELQIGVTLCENKEWLLVKHIPCDYILDGYKIYNKKFIKRRINSSKERFTERVLKLRKTIIEKPADFKFTDTVNCLKWVQDKFGLFEFQDYEEKHLSYGIINRIIGNILIIDFIDTKGFVEENYDFEFEIDEIRSISFESDYFYAIRALWMDENPSIVAL